MVRNVRGRPVHRFERIPGRQAEGLDCTAYAFAARHALMVNVEQRARALGEVAPTDNRRMRAVERLAELNRL